jgi:hypothetical protein
MSVETLQRVYGHHHPDYMRGAAMAIGSKPKQDVSLVVLLVGVRAERTKHKKPA